MTNGAGSESARPRSSINHQPAGGNERHRPSRADRQSALCAHFPFPSPQGETWL